MCVCVCMHVVYVSYSPLMYSLRRVHAHDNVLPDHVHVMNLHEYVDVVVIRVCVVA